MKLVAFTEEFTKFMNDIVEYFGGISRVAGESLQTVVQSVHVLPNMGRNVREVSCELIALLAKGY